MLRLYTIIATIWRFGLDALVIEALGIRSLRLWARLRRFRTPAPVRLRQAMEHLGPIFVKFGQLLSTRRDLLGADYADALAGLQDRVPAEKEASIRTALQNACDGRLQAALVTFDITPIGSASIAQVHKAQLAGVSHPVAIKILRPGVRQRIRQDLRLLTAFASLMQMFLKDATRLKPLAVTEEFAAHLQEETSLLREAANCAKLGRNFADSPAVRIPSVHWEWCTDDVMVMDYIHSVAVDKLDTLAHPPDKSRLAAIGIDIFFTQIFRDNFFHADAHPGNIHVDEAGRFVLFDFGIVGLLSDFDKEYLLRNFLAFFNRDYLSVARMHIEAGWTPAGTDLRLFEAEIRTVCEPIFAQPLKNISFGRFLLKMFLAARKFNLEVQPQLLLLQKTLINVESIGRDLDPTMNMWDIAKPIVERWAAQPYRLRSLLRELRERTPDWLALARDFPPTARALIRHSSQTLHRDEAPWRRRAYFWRWVSVFATLSALSSLAWALMR